MFQAVFSRRLLLQALALGGSLYLSSCAAGVAPREGAAGTKVGTRSAVPGGASSVRTTVATGGVPAGRSTLTYYNWFGPSDPQSQVFPHAEALFRQQHPGVTISNNMVGGGIEKLQTKLEVLVA